MKTILRVPTPNGDVDVDVEINESEFAKLAAAGFKQLMTPTGYERVEKGENYHFISASNLRNIRTEDYTSVSNELYKTANYYTSIMLAENNARADQLMRQLRRFAVEHREREIDWSSDAAVCKWYIDFDYYESKMVEVEFEWHYRQFGGIYFDSEEAAQAAIDAFHDELIWYFTEYKDSL